MILHSQDKFLLRVFWLTGICQLATGWVRGPFMIMSMPMIPKSMVFETFSASLVSDGGIVDGSIEVTEPPVEKLGIG